MGTQGRAKKGSLILSPEEGRVVGCIGQSKAGYLDTQDRARKVSWVHRAKQGRVVGYTGLRKAG